jgi:hypothetical protein
MATDQNGMPETEKINTHIVTLTRFLTEGQTQHEHATGDFTYVVAAPRILRRPVPLPLIILQTPAILTVVEPLGPLPLSSLQSF